MPDLLIHGLFALVALVAGGAAELPATSPPGPRPAWVAPLGRPMVVLREFAPPPAAAPWTAGHRGVDLAGVAGAAVLADAAGRVTFAGVVAGRGVVVVAHSTRLRSTFEPVRATVHAGDTVSAGTEIGRLEAGPGPGGWGPSCPGRPCLHWGMLLDGRYVDPLTASHLDHRAAGRARLLPLDLPLAGVGTEPVRRGQDGAATLTAALGDGRPGPPGAGAVLAEGLAEGAAAAGVVAGSFVLGARVRRRRTTGARPP